MCLVAFETWKTKQNKNNEVTQVFNNKKFWTTNKEDACDEHQDIELVTALPVLGL